MVWANHRNASAGNGVIISASILPEQTGFNVTLKSYLNFWSLFSALLIFSFQMGQIFVSYGSNSKFLKQFIMRGAFNGSCYY